MAFTVVYDANVLYPNTLRDLLIRIAQSGTVSLSRIAAWHGSGCGRRGGRGFSVQQGGGPR